MTTAITWRKPTIVDLFGYEPEPEKNGELSDTLFGRHAEFAVCAQLTKAGYHVTHVDSIGFDLVMVTNDTSYTVQVKSSRTTQQGRCRWNAGTEIKGSHKNKRAKKHTRALTPSDADLLALFHHIYETTIFIPILSELPRSFSFPASHVERATIEESLAPALAALSKASA